MLPTYSFEACWCGAVLFWNNHTDWDNQEQLDAARALGWWSNYWNKCLRLEAHQHMKKLCKLLDEFEARNILPIAIGNDSVTNYRQWIADIEDIQSTKVRIPLISDAGCNVLARLGCARVSPVLNEMVPVSLGVFLIDVDKRIRSSMRYSPTTGRNFYEILRLFDGLQLVSQHHIVTPSNWGIGEDVMLQVEVTEEEEACYRFVEVRPWFKLTPCPET